MDNHSRRHAETHSRHEKGATLRIANDRQEVDYYYHLPSKPWLKTEDSAEFSGMNHNILGGFLDERPTIYASGTGKGTFRSFRYWFQPNESA